MESLRYVKSEDQPLSAAAATQAAAAVDASTLCGTWINTNDASSGIVKVIVKDGEGGLRVQAFGACEPAPCDWGEVAVEVVYAKSVSSQEAMAFSAAYDFGYMESYMQANLSLGLLVVACFNKFKDGSGRANYFSREFFHS